MKSVTFKTILIVTITTFFLLTGTALGESIDSLIVTESGRVGIGTDTPSSMLHIKHDTYPSIQVEDSTNNATAQMQASDSQINIGSKTNHSVYFIVNDQNKAIIDQNGNVGIGTTSPSSYYSNELVLYDNETFGLKSGLTIVSANNAYGRISFADGTSGDDRYRGSITYDHNYDRLYFNANADTVMSLVGGKVGIGDTTPQGILDIRTSNGAFLRVHRSYCHIIQHNYASDKYWALSPRSNDKWDISIQSSDPGTGYISSSNAVMTFEPNGNVGIGTTNPGKKLEVDASVNNNYATLIHNGGGNGYGLLVKSGAASAVPTFAVQDNYGTERFRVQSNGKVGIGTPNPAEKLHVVGKAGNNTGVWSNLCDRRLKKNIQGLHGALGKVLKLRGVTFEWKDPEQHGNQNGSLMGFIAQEVKEVIPEWVNTFDDGYNWITPQGFKALMVEALKELKSEKDSEINLLKAENAELKNILTQLSSKLSQIEEKITSR